MPRRVLKLTAQICETWFLVRCTVVLCRTCVAFLKFCGVQYSGTSDKKPHPRVRCGLQNQSCSMGKGQRSGRVCNVHRSGAPSLVFVSPVSFLRNISTSSVFLFLLSDTMFISTVCSVCYAADPILFVCSWSESCTLRGLCHGLTSALGRRHETQERLVQTRFCVQCRQKRTHILKVVHRHKSKNNFMCAQIWRNLNI